MPTAETVTTEIRIESIDDMMDANKQLMEEVFNDGKMTAAEKMKSFSTGVRNQVVMSRDQQARIQLLARLGMKANGEMKSLSFNPAGDSSS